MIITEIFKSIQGEGTRAGLPCIFVRLTGCNLRCTWCDTAYAFHGGKKRSGEEVLARLVERLPREVIKILDVKCPDSGEPETFEMRNLEALTENDEVKFVLWTRRDYEFAREFTLQHGLARRAKQVLFSPVFEDREGKWQGLEPRTLAEWILADGLPVRLGLQLHKFIWDPATKGV